MSDGAATRAFYGRWARLYDAVATAPGVGSWRARTVDALALSPGETVVEMGVGTGANLALLREVVGDEGRVIGVDLTRGMLARASARSEAAGWSNVHLVQGDATRPPVRGEVDAVVATFLVGMLPDPAEAVREWLDLLAPGGRLALLNAARSPYWPLAPLNLAFRGFVRLGSPGWRGGRSGVTSLEERIDAATTALAAGTETHERELLGGGFGRLRWGRLAE